MYSSYPKIKVVRGRTFLLAGEWRYDSRMAAALSSSIRSISLSSDVYRPVIAAIDFGTSSSGYAFAVRPHEEEALKPSAIQLNKWQIGTVSSFTDKAPSTVLLKPDKSFDSFGYKAEDKFAKLCATGKARGWWFFERFKMALYKAENLSRETTLLDAENKPMLAIHVFAEVIAHLKEQILHDVRMQNKHVTDDDVLYVITVPAIWSDAAKQFMREAATSPEVGLNDDQLKLVLEPEAASVYCRQTLSAGKRDAKGSLKLSTLPVGHVYIIVDLGGGTADIATHKIIENELLHEVLNARGDDLGGQQFNENFLNFLEDLFGDVFKTWKRNERGDFQKLQRSIEGIKWELSECEEEILFELPYSLADTVQRSSGESLSGLVSKSKLNSSLAVCGSGKLLIDYSVVKSFFDKVLGGIEKQLCQISADVPGLETVFLVGGMAKSRIIRQFIQQKFPSYDLVVPEDPGIAVLKGAVMLGHQPKAIAGRIARYTYGVGVVKPFIDGVHDVKYKIKLDGEYNCNNLFSKKIEKAQILSYGKTFTENVKIKAIQADTKRKDFYAVLFTSTATDPLYVDEPGCVKAGVIKLVPPPGGWPDHTAIVVQIVVGEAELKFYVKEQDGREYETKVDFLKATPDS